MHSKKPCKVLRGEATHQDHVQVVRITSSEEQPRRAIKKAGSNRREEEFVVQVSTCSRKNISSFSETTKR